MSYPYGSGSGGGYPGYSPMPSAGGYPNAQMPQPAPAGLPYAPQPYGTSYPASPGMPQPGMPQPGMPQPGMPQAGMPQPGMPQPGMPQAGGYPQTGGYPQGSGYPSHSGMPVPNAQSAMPQAGYPGGSSTQPGYPSGPGAPPHSTQMPTAGYPASGMTAPTSSPYPSSAAPSAPAPGSSSQATQPAQSPYKSVTNQPSAPSSSSTQKSSASKMSKDANSTYYYTCAQKPGDSGTITALTTGFNPEADATQIRNTLKSISVNETVLVNILPHRSNAQRQKIRAMYKTMYGQDLLQDFRTRLSGDFESVCAALIMQPAEYDAYLIHKAIEGAGTDEEVLVEILCTRTNAQTTELASCYMNMYKVKIETDLKGDSSGHFKRMLISLANGARLEDQGVDSQKADEDAKKLHKAGAARLGTDESTFNSILVSQSYEQLRAVFDSYQRLYRKDMEKVIKSEMSGDLERGMKTIVRFTQDKHSYFANHLYKAMKGIGTDEKCLIRTLVSRSEIDLANIKHAYNSIKGESKSLHHWIKKETSGPFRDMLVHIIGEGR